MHSGHHRGRENPVLLPHTGGEATHAARGSKSSDDKIASLPLVLVELLSWPLVLEVTPPPPPVHILGQYIISPLFKTSICFVSKCAGVLWCPHSRQGTTCRTQVSPSTVWVPGDQTQSSDLTEGTFID